MNHEMFKKVREHIRQEISSISYKTWIHPLMLGEVKEDEIIILIPKYMSHVVSFIEVKHKDTYKNAINQVCGMDYNVTFKLIENA